MKRPEEHVTDARGQTLLRSALEPLGWTLTLTADYGIDLDVEVFRGGESTGITFKIQLKSSAAPAYSTGGDFVSEPIAVKNVRYLIEMQTPTIIVAADVESGRTFWVVPQNNARLPREIEGRADDATITIRVPTKNVLPDTADDMVRAVGQAKLLLAARTINTVPVIDFVATLRSHPDAEATIRELRVKAAALALDQAFQLMNARELERAGALVGGLWEDPAAPLETKFMAVLVWEQVDTRRAIVSKTSDLERIRLGLRAADRLRSLTRRGPKHLKFYTVLFRKIVELELILHRSWGAFLSVDLAKQGGGGPLWATTIYAWIEVATNVDRKLRQCFRLLERVDKYHHRWALADPVLRFAKTIFLLAGQLKVQGNPDGAARSLEQAFQLFRLSARLAGEAGDEQRVANAVAATRMVSDDPDSPSFRWMTEQLAGLQDPEIKTAAVEYVDRLDRHSKGEKLAFEIETTEQQIYENMAAGAGIDLSDVNDPIAEAIRIGIADLNPERVLRKCEHIFITLGPAGPVSIRMRLPTADRKLLHCTKHRYSVENAKLDDGYEDLRQRYCATCLDGSPRSADWRYSDEWQQRENQRNAKVAERLGITRRDAE